jgi:3-methyl-2-oxobutanoate hydroxymethyltransferase
MSARKKISIITLRERKKNGTKIAMLTCYDYPTARLMAESGIDTILVGDTYAEVCLGHASTLPARMDTMIEVTGAVRRGAPDAFLLGDMPYLSYQASEYEAIHNAGRFMAEAGCDGVKLEVDSRLADTVRALTRATIPVCAHLGLKPQSIHQIGGYRCQGKTADAARALIQDAEIMEQAGAAMLLLEAVPLEVARLITRRTELPVIGCVSGPHCDGTVVVLHDMLGYHAGHPPKSVKTYADVHQILTSAFAAYRADIAAGEFPTTLHSIQMPEGELDKLLQELR